MKRLPIPRAKFSVGDRVYVRCIEAGHAPTFEATVIDVSLDQFNTIFYGIEEEDGLRSDGYTTSWLEWRG